MLEAIIMTEVKPEITQVKEEEEEDEGKSIYSDPNGKYLAVTVISIGSQDISLLKVIPNLFQLR